ncbi:MAG TPA: phosphatidylglycerol lysyltransferase domain-containing protein [Candidatus Wallbacteria bacterium]|nr:phosphatidylglycerol lysyltransferase domain-containing protein [Candidatus Wallbacteria bacterium]
MFGEVVSILVQCESINSLGLEKVNISHRNIFDTFVGQLKVNLSDYTFANNFMWFENADGYIKKINDNLCLFIYNNEALTMLLPPLGNNMPAETLSECFKIMNQVNGESNHSKVDYVYAGYLETVDFSIYEVERQNPDYIYLTSELTELKGNKYKTKRNEINYFTKNFTFDYKPYTFAYRELAIDLIYRWANLRLNSMSPLNEKELDHFVELIELERNAIIRVLDRYEDLDLKGALILINGRAEGITFGEKINANTASILIEKTNFQYFGISQYLFKEFCRREFSDCDFVNVGDDLGFDNLRRVKMSYHPHSYGPKYTIRQKSFTK